MNCATSFALVPASTSTFPPTAADCSTSRGPRPCWPSCKPHDPGLALSQLRRYFLARALTEPIREGDSWREVMITSAEWHGRIMVTSSPMDTQPATERRFGTEPGYVSH